MADIAKVSALQFVDDNDKVLYSVGPNGNKLTFRGPAPDNKALMSIDVEGRLEIHTDTYWSVSIGGPDHMIALADKSRDRTVTIDGLTGDIRFD